MKFDEIPATDSSKKKKSLFMPMMIGIVIIVIALIIYSVYRASKVPKLVELDTNSRLVQSLYTSVHDFKSSSPYWMYEGEVSSSISSMTEGNKMVLAYLNLKASDFLPADDCALLPQENYYGKLVCNDKTMIKKEDVERSYKEVFGDKVPMSTSINMKVNPKDETYIYNAENDAYILYSSVGEKDKDKDKFSKTFKYNYKVYKAEKEGDTVRIYEELTVERVSSGIVENQSKYLYTFVLAEDNIYSYTTIEKIM